MFLESSSLRELQEESSACRKGYGKEDVLCVTALLGEEKPFLVVDRCYITESGEATYQVLILVGIS